MSLTANPVLQSNALLDALLLAATGGMLDANVFVNHGHVFASSMTDNVEEIGFMAIKWERLTVKSQEAVRRRGSACG